MLGLCHFWHGIVSLNNIHIGTFAWKSWQLCTCNWVAVLLFHFSAATDGAHVPTHTEEVDDDDVPGETLLLFSFTLLQTNKLITREKKKFEPPGWGLEGWKLPSCCTQLFSPLAFLNFFQASAYFFSLFRISLVCNRDWFFNNLSISDI